LIFDPIDFAIDFAEAAICISNEVLPMPAGAATTPTVPAIRLGRQKSGCGNWSRRACANDNGCQLFEFITPPDPV
jgi:hypothetical protein